MKFGEQKCAFLQIEKGIIKKYAPLNINHLTIQPVADGDSYKYLGIDESITYNGPLNKEKFPRNISAEHGKYSLRNCLISTKLLHTTALQYLL